MSDITFRVPWDSVQALRLPLDAVAVELQRERGIWLSTRSFETVEIRQLCLAGVASFKCGVSHPGVISALRPGNALHPRGRVTYTWQSSRKSSRRPSQASLRSSSAIRATLGARRRKFHVYDYGSTSPGLSRDIGGYRFDPPCITLLAPDAPLPFWSSDTSVSGFSVNPAVSFERNQSALLALGSRRGM